LHRSLAGINYSANVQKPTRGRTAWIVDRTQRREMRLPTSSSGRRRRGVRRSSGGSERRSARSASRSGKRSGRTASGSARKHGVRRRAPHEQDGPGSYGISAFLRLTPWRVFLSAFWRMALVSPAASDTPSYAVGLRPFALPHPKHLRTSSASPAGLAQNTRW
jgi:hypothetical protein